VGKTQLIEVLNDMAGVGVPLGVQEGIRPRGNLDGTPAGWFDDTRLGLIVWEAGSDVPLAEYAAEYAAQLERIVPRGQLPLPIVVVCSKTDQMPCPLPQIAGLKDAWPFIAVSAERRTNMGLLWEMVEEKLIGLDLEVKRQSDDCSSRASGDDDGAAPGRRSVST